MGVPGRPVSSRCMAFRSGRPCTPTPDKAIGCTNLESPLSEALGLTSIGNHRPDTPPARDVSSAVAALVRDPIGVCERDLLGPPSRPHVLPEHLDPTSL